MKQLPTLILLAFALAGPAAAQGSHGAHGSHAAPTAGAAADLAEGEVRRVDREAGKVTLKHGEIKSLDMPPMTMVFTVRDKAMLDNLKTGDKVRFRAESVSGTYTVTELQPVR